MTPDVLAARLDELEKRLVEQERVRNMAEIAVRQLQGACAIVRELLAQERALSTDEADAPSVGPDGSPERG